MLCNLRYIKVAFMHIIHARQGKLPRSSIGWTRVLRTARLPHQSGFSAHCIIPHNLVKLIFAVLRPFSVNWRLNLGGTLTGQKELRTRFKHDGYLESHPLYRWELRNIQEHRQSPEEGIMINIK